MIGYNNHRVLNYYHRPIMHLYRYTTIICTTQNLLK